MIQIDIELKDSFKNIFPARLQGFIHGDKDLPSILIFPGGGYMYVSDREAEPVADKFYAKGYNAFILTYSTGDRMPEAKFPAQVTQVYAAIHTIRQNAKKWHCTGEIITCGFSAGGHLSGSAAVFYNLPEVLKNLNVKPQEIKPDAAILAYPVVSGTETPHTGSFINLLGEGKEGEYAKYSIENNITSNTPPMFLWHTAEDTCVDVRNSLVLAMSLRKNNIPFALHVFEHGPHGLSIAEERTCVGNPDLINPDVAVWVDLCASWLDARFKNNKK